MWMSMTGFGRGDHHGGDVSVIAEIRSVNHRFLDIHVRCPAKYLSWEMRVRSMVRHALKRGRVDVFLSVKENRVSEEYSLAMDLSFRDLIRVPDIFVFAPEGDDPAEKHWALGESAVRDALDMLVKSRREEGERMRVSIKRGVGILRVLAEELSDLSLENKELARARFRERIEALSEEAGVDPARLQQEAAFLIDRLDISEECERVRSHLAGMESLLGNEGDAVGKRFDFLAQELFRELNTASTKSAHPGISERVVTAKTELEKIREQIQNVE
jgi:uncharacterized protein (TIGR00255 family)